MDVSIIIINYNTEKLVLDCIDSIYKETSNVIFEIIVVDNNSPNKSNILINDKRIKYIQSDTNLGFGRANNLGAEYAKGEYLFCLNPDTILVNNAIKILYNCIKNNPKIGICGGNLLSKEKKGIHSFCTISPGLWNELTLLFKLNFLNSQYNKSNKIIDVSYITGADLMIKKDIFEKVKGFDKDFFMYFEETYLCYLVRSLGYRIVNVPQSLIIHLEGKSFTLNKHREKLFYSSRKIYLLKRYNRLYYYLCNIIHLLMCSIRMILSINNKDRFSICLYRIKLLFN